MKRTLIVLALVLTMLLAFASAAYANFGPHGGYVGDTDACAGCHRAHTSFSTVGWKDQLGTNHSSALLVGNATSMTMFCAACHGDTAPGAATNVASGVFDSGPSGSTGIAVGGSSLTAASSGTYPGDGGVVSPTSYHTASTFNAPLNGGGFDRMPDFYSYLGLPLQGGTGTAQTAGTVTYVASTSAHKMDVNGPLWGAGVAPAMYGGSVGLTCTDCHDPHGSSNYRLLKAEVNGVTVGGYNADGTTNAYVFSSEQGYPVPSSATNFGGGVQNGSNPGGGWMKHADGAAQMALYYPNYTDTTGTPLLHTQAAPGRSISAWCAACHTNYNPSSAGTGITYSYTNPSGAGYLPAANTPDAAQQVGTTTYHRHAVDVALAAGAPNPANPLQSLGALTEPVAQDSNFVPLEMNAANNANWYDNYMGCLTCHRAHGSSVLMTGFAAAHLESATVTVTDASGSSITTGVYVPVRDNVPGVDPDKGIYGTSATPKGTSALLRANNRGVCERCHNK